MFNDRKHTARYIHPVSARRNLQQRRLNIEAWLEGILIVAVGVLTYVILVGP